MSPPSANPISRRHLLGLGALSIATLGGVATIVRSTAHDGHDHGEHHHPATPSASPAAEANVFTIETQDTYFHPKQFAIPADTDVILRIVNLGRLQHDFVCEPLGFSSRRISAGEEADIAVHAAAGRYQFSCSVPGHKILGMVGVLTAE